MVVKAPDRYAVFGHPIRHSKSPLIHSQFAEQTGQNILYSSQDVDLPQFEDEARTFFLNGGMGLNCTLPLKEAAFCLADACSARAGRARAVNTLVLRPDGTLFGDNTDGAGLLRDLTVNLGLKLAGTRVLILGAGGATRGIIAPLLETALERLVIANRTASRAVLLADEFAALGNVSGCGFADLADSRYELILNATAASLTGQLPPLSDDLLTPGGCCYDLAYAETPTAFVRWGQTHGASVSVDGLGMLVEQAAEAFLLWRGVRPETAPVIGMLRAD